MPIRIYTTTPARQLMEDRPFGIVAWTDDARLGEAHAIVYLDDGTPLLRGTKVSLAATEPDGNIEHAMRAHLGQVWRALPQAHGTPFGELIEEIPVEEFAITQIEKPAIRGLVAQIALEAQSGELAKAFAAFHQNG